MADELGEPTGRRDSVLVTGKFNPAIFHYIWLKQQGVLTEDEEVDEAASVTTSSISVVRTKDLSVQVTPQRALLQAQRPSTTPESLATRAVATLEALPHVPVESAEMVSERDIDQLVVGWSRLKNELRLGDLAHHVDPGSSVTSFVLERGPDDEGIQRRLVIEASRLLADGVYVRVHVKLRIGDAPTGTAPVARTFVQRHSGTAAHDVDELIKRLERTQL